MKPGIVSLLSVVVVAALSACGPSSNGEGNRPPSFVALDAVSLEALSVMRVVLAATDPDGDAVSFSVSDPPAWVSLEGVQLVLRPTAADLGTHTLSVTASDGRGGETSGAITIDVTRPPAVSLPGSVEIEGQYAFVNAREVALRLSVTALPNVPLASMQFSNDGVAYSEPAAFAETATWSLSEGDGEKSVHVRVLDQLGNVGEFSVSTTLDMTPPEVTFELAGGAPWINTSKIEIVADATDALSGIAEACMVDELGGEHCFPPSPDPFQWPIRTAAGGKQTMVFAVTDVAGNQTTVAKSFGLDGVRPYVDRIEINGEANPAVNSRTLQVTAIPLPESSDASPVDSVCVGMTASELDCELTPEFVRSYTLPDDVTDGIHHVYVALRDAAGNVSNPAGIPVEYDTTPPSVWDVSHSAGSSTLARQFELRFESSDGGRLPHLVQVSFDGGTTFTDGEPVKGSPMSLSLELPDEDGVYDVALRLVDRAGNQTVHGFRVTLDRTPPTGTLALNTPDGSEYTRTRDLPLTLTWNEGTDAYCVRLDPTPPEPYSGCWARIGDWPGTFRLPDQDRAYEVYGWLRDAAGNVSERMQVVAWLDTKGPTCPSPFITKVVEGDRRIRVEWNEATDEIGPVYYHVDLAPEVGSVRSTSPNDSFVEFTGLPNGMSHQLVIRAADGAGYSTKCADVPVTPRAPFERARRLPTANNLLAVTARGTERYVAVGAASDVLIGTYSTVDYGDLGEDGVVLHGVAFDGESTGVATSIDGGIFFTKTGGASWQRIDRGDDDTDVRNVFYAGEREQNGSSWTLFLVSGEGGLVRVLVSASKYSSQTSISRVALAVRPETQLAHCPASDCGAQGVIVAGSVGSVLRSTDGGDSFQSTSLAYSPGAVTNMPGTKRFYAAAGGTLLRSNDAGLTWTAEAVFPQGLQPERLLATSDGQLLLSGRGGGPLLFTWDGANFATDHSLPQDVLGVADMTRVSDTAIVVVGRSGTILRAGRGSGRWFFTSQSQGSPSPVTDLGLSPNRVWVTSDGLERRSRTTGAQESRTGVQYSHTSIIDDQRLWAVNGTRPWRSTDAGLTFSDGTSGSNQPPQVALRDIECRSPQSCLVVGGQSTFKRWDGNSWTTVATNSAGEPLRRVASCSDTVAIAVGLDGLVMRLDTSTAPATVTSAVLPGFTGESREPQVACRDGLALVAAESNAVWVSTSSGASWTRVAMPEQVKAVGLGPWYGTLYAGGAGGLHVSVDIGGSWTRHVLPSDTPISAIAADGNEVWVGTMGGGLYVARQRLD